MLEPIIRKNAFGGKGEVTLRPLLTDEQKNEMYDYFGTSADKVETIEVIESIEFFFRLGSAALRIGEHNGALFIYYTVIVLT